MIAICPAGPPKLMKPSFSQKRNALHLVLGARAPGVQRVVHRHAVPEHLVVVGEAGRQPERQRHQPGRLRGEVRAVGVRAAHDHGERLERRVAQAVAVDEGVKAAAAADVRELDVGDVVGNRRALLRDAQDVRRRHVEELRVRVDEAPDQPRAGDAVHLGALARHPAGRRAGGLRRALAVPVLDAALEEARPQGLRHALADLMAVDTIDDRVGVRGQAPPPILHGGGVAAQRAADHVGGRKECGRLAHVDDERRAAGPKGFLKY